MGVSEAKVVFDDIRRMIASTPILYDNQQKCLHVSVSIGVCVERTESLIQMIKVADDYLYKAKKVGVTVYVYHSEQLMQILQR